MIYTHLNKKLITKLNRTCSTKVQLILAMSVLGVLFLWWEVIKNMDEKEVVTRFYNSINEEQRVFSCRGSVRILFWNAPHLLIQDNRGLTFRQVFCIILFGLI